MGGRGSGGHNRLPVAVPHLQGTFKPSRHGTANRPPLVAVSAAERRRTLAGLDGEARRIAAALLAEYGGWDAATLHSLRLYAVSCARLGELTDDAERRRETRTNLALLKALDLEPRRIRASEAPPAADPLDRYLEPDKWAGIL